MFPPVKVTFSVDSSCSSSSSSSSCSLSAGQLSSSARDKYQVLMDILPYDNKRYRYAYHKSSWQQAGKADPPSPAKLFLHPDGPFTLDQLKRQVISFEKIKLTNNDANKHGYIVLNSMHKYQPRIHLVLWRGKDSQQNMANGPVSLLENEIYKTFIFSETIFTAVTAYQNHSITKLKIDSNPFAKGFRDSTRITDLELETINDLMSDGQCPFSPPHAPPHGFPHFLFAAAAAQQQQHLGVPGACGPTGPAHEDPASALLRERTIMALDSFLQQQQQQQQQHPPVSGPHRTPGGAGVGAPQPPGLKTGAASCGQSLGAHLGAAHSLPKSSPQPPPPYPPPPYTSSSVGGSAPPGTPFFSSAHSGPPGGAQMPANLEQFFMQQQQQFAAVMAVAAAAQQHPGAYAGAQHAHLPPHLQSLFGQLPSSFPSGRHRVSPTNNKLGSPVSASSASGGAGGLRQGELSPSSAAELTDMGGAAPAPAQYPMHPSLAALAAAHHKHQMASLSLQLHDHQLSHPQHQHLHHNHHLHHHHHHRPEAGAGQPADHLVAGAGRDSGAGAQSHKKPL